MHFESLKKIMAILFKDFESLKTDLNPRELSRKLSGLVLMYMGDVERYRAQIESDFYK